MDGARSENSLDPLERWLLSLSESSRDQYSYCFRKYMEYLGTGELEPIIMRARADIVWLDDHLKQFREWIKSKHYAPGSGDGIFSAIRSFYSWNYVTLPKLPVDFNKSGAFEPDRIYTRREIKAMFDAATSKTWRAMLAFLRHSAQRVQVVRALKIMHVADALRNQEIGVVSVGPYLLDSRGRNCNKTRSRYKFAFGSECSRLLSDMIDERMQFGERVSSESWLFVKPDGKPFSGRNIDYVVNTLAERARIQEYVVTPKTKRAVFHAHGFRRTWKATVRSAWRTLKLGMDSELLQFQLGHTLPQRGCYDKFTAEDMRDFFADIESFMNISSPDTKSSETLYSQGKRVHGAFISKVFPHDISKNAAEITEADSLTEEQGADPPRDAGVPVPQSGPAQDADSRGDATESQ